MVDKKRRSAQAPTVSAEGGSESTTPAPTPSAAIMLNHIPEGFFERAMYDYFTQFGTVRRVRVARSKKTGNFKGYAFVLFTDVDVAQIAAEAMDGYLMFEKRMTCKRLMNDQIPNCLKHGPAVLQQLPKSHDGAEKHARTLNRKRSHRA
uniref:RRM domain-containing protein n=2 Tax=Plectus sambesii TaxID=2011161 RepID=A0A914V4U1_9BILA